MTCERCRDEATVHLSETIEGERRELHLCGTCARKAGIALPQNPPDLALDAVLQGLITANVGELVGALARTECPCCGVTFRDYRTDLRLGCPVDYRIFHHALLPMLRQFHLATRHVGKIPARRPVDPEPILRMRADLRGAVASENFEKAARLRDEIRLRLRTSYE
jgi:protein arginine kinase activator